MRRFHAVAPVEGEVGAAVPADSPVWPDAAGAAMPTPTSVERSRVAYSAGVRRLD